MTTVALAERKATQSEAIERVLIQGDLSKLSVEERLSYNNAVCASLGLNPLTQPFKYIPLSGKLTLYATKDCTEQLRKLHGVSVVEVTSMRLEDVFVVTAKAQDKTGRTDAATGAVPIGNLKGEALANALMKAETKAKRRVTLSICGLGMLDETELDTISGALPILPTVSRITLPDGTWQILNVQIDNFGNGTATVVNHAGEEETYPIKGRECAELCEQVQQEAVPVILERVKGQRDNKVKIAGVKRYAAPKPEEPPAPPISAKDIAF